MWGPAQGVICRPVGESRNRMVRRINMHGNDSDTHPQRDELPLLWRTHPARCPPKGEEYLIRIALRR